MQKPWRYKCFSEGVLWADLPDVRLLPKRQVLFKRGLYSLRTKIRLEIMMLQQL